MAAGQFAKDPAVDRALRHSVRDGMAFSIAAGGGETYFSAYALFFGATAPQVALLTTLPPLLGSLAQILSAWLGNFYARKRLILLGAGAQALTWLPILVLPMWFPAHAVPILLALFTLYHAAANLVAPQWTSMMRDLVSERRRGRYFGYRTKLTTATSFVALAVCGFLLHAFDTAGNTYMGYVVIFLIAYVARSVSVYHLSFLHELPNPTPAPDIHVSHWWGQLTATGAVSFSRYFILMNGAVGIAAPFFTVYMLRDLELTYFQFTVVTGTSVLVQFLTLSTWGRIADVYGNRLILIVSSISLPLVPLLWMVSANVWYLIVVQALTGLFWAGFSLAGGNLLFELVPRSRRAAYVAFHNVGTAAGVFVGAMVGAAAATLLPAQQPFLGAAAHPSNLLGVFAISAVVRAIVAGLLAHHVRDLRKPRRELTPQALVLRVTGFNAMLGLLYDFIGRGTPAPKPPQDGLDLRRPLGDDARDRRP
ncbi:MAG TPA: MFS transporter [Gammaproteobacteria bacterium]